MRATHRDFIKRILATPLTQPYKDVQVAEKNRTKKISIPSLPCVPVIPLPRLAQLLESEDQKHGELNISMFCTGCKAYSINTYDRLAEKCTVPVCKNACGQKMRCENENEHENEDQGENENQMEDEMPAQVLRITARAHLGHKELLEKFRRVRHEQILLLKKHGQEEDAEEKRDEADARENKLPWVGEICATVDPLRETVYVDSLQVKPGWRNEKLGTKLMRLFLASAPQDYDIHLVVGAFSMLGETRDSDGPGNIELDAFYRKLGFRSCSCVSCANRGRNFRTIHRRRHEKNV